MNLQKDIDSYFVALREIKDSINQLKGEKFLENHQKTLLFSLIETMAKGKYGDKYKGKNYIRFAEFIHEFCNWEESERVSLQQLALLLEKTEKHEFIKLKEYVIQNLKQYPMASAVPFSYDSTVEEIIELMPKGVTQIKGVDINSLTHIKLLWKYRNNLVHEARSIASNELFDEVDYPHYVHYTILEKDRQWEVWKICYPINFFNGLIDNAFVNLRKNLIENDQDPRKNYDFNELWVKPR